MPRAILNEVNMKQPITVNFSQGEKTVSYPSIFPKPPLELLPSGLSSSRSESAGSGFSDLDSNSEDEKSALFPQNLINVSRLLPPIGVFWDIENCQVPRKKSAVAIAQAIRDRFFAGYREAEFVVVCDVTKENSKVIQELNYAQVNLIHVSAICKNAADEKLRQSIRRFADIHSSPAAIILISSDINFAGDLNDLRHRKKIHVILLHNENISEALILCANEHYNFGDIIESTVCRREVKEPSAVEVVVSNLPKDKDSSKIRSRLKQLCDNLGGRVFVISKNVCTIRFSTMEHAIRAQKRMDGEDVFGNKISVSNPIPVDDWSFHGGGGGGKKCHSKEEQQQLCQRGGGGGAARKAKDENDFYPQQKQFPGGDVGSHNLDPTFQQQLSKSMAPFFSNNVSSFNFSKIPSIENLKVLQNPTAYSQKSYLNNLENHIGGIGPDPDRDGKQYHLETRKFNNIFTNQADWSMMRLNNSTSGENGTNNVDNHDLLLAQARLIAQNALVQRNLAHSAAIAQLAAGQLSKANGDPAASGRLIRGIHGGNSNNSNSSSNMSNNSNDNIVNRIPPLDEDSDSLISVESGQDCSGGGGSVGAGGGNSPVDLHISGLDPFMDLMMTKNLLFSIFKMHVGVLSVSVFCLTDGNVVASVKVPTIQDAQYAISQLQRCQIGSRRITIAFQNSSKYQRQLTRSQVAQLLSELPQNKIPLFRFTELFKSRFLNSVSVSELSKMKDVCLISEEDNGRMISANTRSQSNSQRQEKKEAIIPYCPIHAQKTLSDSEPPTLPTVRIGLSILSKRIERLLKSHGGKLPILSLSDCYQAQFGPLPEDPQGVPLEHLVSCMQGIEVTQCQGSFKYLTWPQQAGQASNEEQPKCVSPMLVGTMSVFTREALDLLRETPRCVLPFSQFIPSYHRRYGRQCRVSDYGYTKLLDLLESLPHVLQVIGNGSYKMVTLSHKAQIRRFTSDLMKILKSQTKKQIEKSNFPGQYEKIIGRAWDPCHYGLCELDDLLSCVPQSTIVVETREDGQTYISIPKREQTPKEMELTKKFAQEAVELLKRVPNCSMAFSRFVPAYHNQFGRQCRVSSYGCFKLIELFEAIPDTVTIEEDASRGEKYVVLTPAKRLQVLAERVCEILASEGGMMLLSRLEVASQVYQCESAIYPSDYNCKTFEEVLAKIPEYVKIEDSTNGRVVVLKNEMDPNVLIRRVRFVLLHNEKMASSQFVKVYMQQYGHKLDLDVIVNKIPEVFKIQKKGGESFVQLTPLSIFANQMYFLLYDHRGRLSLPNFESAYQSKFKKAVQPTQFGFPNLSSLLTAIPETVTVQNGGYYTHKRIIALNMDLKNAGYEMPVLNNDTPPQKSQFDGTNNAPAANSSTSSSSSSSSESSSSNSSSSSSLSSSSCLVEEGLPPAYDLWKSDSLFPSWKDINGLIPENITVPHPSELPLPSPKLSSPIQKMLRSESECGSEAEVITAETTATTTSTTVTTTTTTTTTTDGEKEGEAPEVVETKTEGGAEQPPKRKNRIAAQFENNLV